MICWSSDEWEDEGNLQQSTKIKLQAEVLRFFSPKMNRRTNICLSGNAVMTNADSERKRKTLLPFYFKRDICLYYALLDMASIYIVNV